MVNMIYRNLLTNISSQADWRSHSLLLPNNLHSNPSPNEVAWCHSRSYRYSRRLCRGLLWLVTRNKNNWELMFSSRVWGWHLRIFRWENRIMTNILNVKIKQAMQVPKKRTQDPWNLPSATHSTRDTCVIILSGLRCWGKWWWRWRWARGRRWWR